MRRPAQLLPLLVLLAAAAFAEDSGVIIFTAPDGTRRIVNVPGTSSSGAPARAVPQGLRERREELWPVVQQVARGHGLDPNLVDLVIRMESGYNPRAVSPKGARGVMQLMPGTASMLGVSDSFDPRENIGGGVRYLRQLLDRFSANLGHALAAYNAGPEAVARHGGVPPYRETQNYVHAILSAYQGDVSVPVLTGGFGKPPGSPSRPVALTATSAGPLITNAPTPGEAALGRRLALR